MPADPAAAPVLAAFARTPIGESGCRPLRLSTDRVAAAAIEGEAA